MRNSATQCNVSKLLGGVNAIHRLYKATLHGGLADIRCCSLLYVMTLSLFFSLFFIFFFFFFCGQQVRVLEGGSQLNTTATSRQGNLSLYNNRHARCRQISKWVSIIVNSCPSETIDRIGIGVCTSAALIYFCPSSSGIFFFFFWRSTVYLHGYESLAMMNNERILRSRLNHQPPHEGG